MGGFTSWIRATVVVGGALTVAACSTYPDEPRYSTRPTPVGGQGAYPAQPQQPGGYPNNNPYYAQSAQPQTPPPARPYEEQGVRAPTGSVEGGGLPPAGGPAYPSTSAPVAPIPTTPSRPNSGPVIPGVAYVIQPGDTISGVGRRFQTPVQTLIDLNGLGPRGAISQGQRIILPDSAVDAGSDPYATGPSPVGVRTPNNGVIPPPPPPPSGNAALPPSRAPAMTSSTPASSLQGAAVGQALAMQWPVRGDILRRFGPVGMGERNNGINIGASAGTEVKAAAAGRVAYVGDDLVGQGLTVLIVHKDGWRTVYGHLGSATVRDGAEVRAGQAIGTVGLTAGDGRPSIHFETRQMRGDDPVAVDPLGVLPR
ncbi:peptidoglycan DD-metalloendopeptidase family protein [Brevundimonas bullata]|uniref:peptidoglycan DD-metalloendopeptidase family protein n=1 Tax=Brevundimonas bullata TaxID=13160 RepID=UPI0019B3C22B|nr:peptidoglycan DD-metalloendopeptidase family protein [Brevundimonas sp.]